MKFAYTTEYNSKKERITFADLSLGDIFYDNNQDYLYMRIDTQDDGINCVSLMEGLLCEIDYDTPVSLYTGIVKLDKNDFITEREVK